MGLVSYNRVNGFVAGIRHLAADHALIRCIVDYWYAVVGSRVVRVNVAICVVM